jgi:DUF1365 family protein
MQSCLYVGRVRHRRFAPQPHEFGYGLFMVYLDLAELDQVFSGRWLWSARRPALAWFRRADYLGDGNTPLDQAVRDLVEQKTGTRPRGPLRMLTHLRYFGHCFNPVTFYYCFDAAAERVETIVAEITNTPWQERHGYVLNRSMDRGDRSRHVYRFAKNFHVSPFMPMDLDYDWRFRDPNERLSVHMSLLRAGEKVFDATLSLRRREITGASLAWALLRFPFMTLKVIAGIYFQAALLKLKGTPFYDHPAANSFPDSGEKPS